jgi:hypothetical protein
VSGEAQNWRKKPAGETDDAKTNSVSRTETLPLAQQGNQRRKKQKVREENCSKKPPLAHKTGRVTWRTAARCVHLYRF